jgi:hypothetical protein
VPFLGPWSSATCFFLVEAGATWVHRCLSAGAVITKTAPLTTHSVLFQISVSPGCESRFRERKGKYKFQFSAMLFDIPYLIQTGLHESLQWTLRRFKSLFSPRTLRADGVMRLYKNSIKDFVLMVVQLIKISSPLRRIPFSSPWRGKYYHNLQQQIWRNCTLLGVGYQISHSPTIKAHANQSSVTHGKFRDPALQTAV